MVASMRPKEPEEPAPRTSSRGHARQVRPSDIDQSHSHTQTLRDILVADWPDQADEIMDAIRPVLADESIAMATVVLTQVFLRLSATPKGEALRHLLGLPYTRGTLSATARALGCTKQAIHGHVTALAPFFRGIATTRHIGLYNGANGVKNVKTVKRKTSDKRKTRK